MHIITILPLFLKVAPLAGAWIETETWNLPPVSCLSRPSRARGLKLHIDAAGEGDGALYDKIRLLRPGRLWKIFFSHGMDWCISPQTFLGEMTTNE